MTTPARFFAMPDGTPSHVQLVVGPDGEPRPLEVKTPEQLAEWTAIQDAMPPGRTVLDARRAAASARPLFRDGEVEGLAEARVAQRLAEAVEVVEETSRGPATGSEWQERANRASQLAARLGLRLTWVVEGQSGRSTIPAHFELSGSGEWGNLEQMERILAEKWREKARVDTQAQLVRERMERIEAERAQAIYNSPVNRLARLERRLAELGVSGEGD